jgi:predicted RNA-binding protein with PUA-like domain
MTISGERLDGSTLRDSVKLHPAMTIQNHRWDTVRVNLTHTTAHFTIQEVRTVMVHYESPDRAIHVTSRRELSVQYLFRRL